MQSLEENGINGYFYEKINYDNVFESLNENISDNYGIYVSDRLGQNIYSYDTFTDKNKEYNLSLPEITKKYPDKNKDYFIVKKQFLRRAGMYGFTNLKINGNFHKTD